MATVTQIDKIIFNGGTSAELQSAVNLAIQQGKPLQLAPTFQAPAGLTNSFAANSIRVSGAKSFRLFAEPGTVTLKLDKSSDFILGIFDSSNVEISGITFDAGYNPAAAVKIVAAQGALYAQRSKRLRIEKCRITNSATNGISLYKCGTEVTTSFGSAGAFDDQAGTIAECEVSACFNGSGIFVSSSPGSRITRNMIRDIKGNGIFVSDYDYKPLADTPAAGNTTYKSYFNGAVIEGNFITDIAVISASSTGQEGNGIVAWLANQVTVSNNAIRYCKFSAIRLNSCSQAIITGNNCYGLGETAIYVEEPDGAVTAGKHPVGTVISANMVNHCMNGLTLTNFLFANAGCRLASVTGNIVRNAHRVGKSGGIGITASADTAVTGNVVECAATVGIALGVNDNCRDLLAVGNIVRNSPLGIGVADNSANGAVLVSANLLHQITAGTGIVGTIYNPATTGPNSTYSTGALADGQTAKSWVKLSNNYTSLLSAPTVSSDGCEPAFPI